MEPALFQYDDIQIVINRSVPNLLPEAEDRNNGFDQSQDEVDVAQGDKSQIHHSRTIQSIRRMPQASVT